MAYCRNCGSEVGDGIKFCTNCGTAIDEMSRSKKPRKEKREETGFDKFSKFFGIILLLIAIVDFNSDPPILTIILSLAIIVGAVFCLSQKYRLKGFTIIALILALICFFCGISQGKELGFLKVAKDEDYAKAYSENTTENEAPSVQAGSDNNEVATPAIKSDNDKAPEVVEEPETDTSEPAENIDGVDPELKAFLDSYEEFMDEYIEFMKKYMDDPGNAVLMLGEYATIMEKYGEFAEDVEKYDEKEMSTEDAKYYLEVTNRINQKMLEIY